MFRRDHGRNADFASDVDSAALKTYAQAEAEPGLLFVNDWGVNLLISA